eukprot:TRINITY_DN1891_c0_g1_i2.p1 TRINITY_DN1891_c0_g1~~TRINITY_DN1891_c0_g1_i2.p1  ORF type:complete len:463 (-),score=115.21 TRINITY_DN1891_c0_g1_i2:33-1421(-)
MLCVDYYHKHKTQPCIVCELYSIFLNYKCSVNPIIPPDALRAAMAEIYHSEERFKMGEMYDAEEALNEILKLLHCDQVASAITDPESLPHYQDVACAPSCLSHAAFGTQVCDLNICKKCGTPSEPIPVSSLVYRAYAGELLDTKKYPLSMSDSSGLRFSEILRSAYQAQEFSCFDEKCNGKATTQRWCLKFPEVFAIGLGWQDEPSKESIAKVLDTISEIIDIGIIFRLSTEESSKAKGESRILKLRGFISYYGKHYVAFFYSENLKTWLLFDDQRVERLGSWRQAKLRSARSRFQPVLIFYERDSNVQASIELAKSMVPEKPTGPIEQKISETSKIVLAPLPEPTLPSVIQDSPFVDYPPPNSPQPAADWLCEECKAKWQAQGCQCCPVCELPRDSVSSSEWLHAEEDYEIVSDPDNDVVMVNANGEEEWENWECFACRKTWRTDKFSCAMCDALRLSLQK